MRTNMRNKYGFTMLEMMATIVILSIVTTLSIVGFRRSINHQKVIGETNTLMSKLKYIGSEARVSKRQLSILLDYKFDRMVAWQDSDGNGAINVGEAVLDSMRFTHGIDLYGGRIGSTSKTDKQTFVFYDDGTVANDIYIVVRSKYARDQKVIYIRKQSGSVEHSTVVPTGFSSF